MKCTPVQWRSTVESPLYSQERVGPQASPRGYQVQMLLEEEHAALRSHRDDIPQMQALSSAREPQWWDQKTVELLQGELGT